MPKVTRSRDKAELHLSKEQGLQCLPGPDPNDSSFATVFKNRLAEVLVYSPKQIDQQEPHDRDEFYIIVGGSGEFINGENRSTFVAGDVIFVPAHRPHRFVNFTDDFVTWVVFFGPTDDQAYFSE